VKGLPRLLLGRLARLVLTLLVSSFLIFAASALAPGSPLAALSGGRSLPEASQRLLVNRFHLNDPFLVRYVKWVGNALHGDFGISIGQRTDVSTLIASRIWVTAQLVLFAAIIIVLVGVSLGIFAGLRPGAADSSVLVATALLAAVPSFVAAVLLSLVFVARLDWLPALGEGDGFMGRIEHLILPAVALALSSLAIVARVTRAAVRAELDREHVQTAVSRGIPRRQIVRRHVVRNAAIPIVTVSGLVIASLVALAAIVERAFALNGLGSYLVRAAASKDIAVVQGISMVIVVVFVVVNLVVDLLYVALDPRVRDGAA
jgi:peptide/nickel transport system permease protein